MAVAADPHTTTPWGSPPQHPGVVAGAPRWMEVADWCAPTPWLYSMACEQLIRSPIWCLVLVADAVGIWLILAIWSRQREQDQETKFAKLALARPLRARRGWRVVAATARLATLAAAQSGGQVKRLGESSRHWEKCWDGVAKARSQRTVYLSKIDFNLGATLTRAMGPLMLCVVSIIIAFLTHTFYVTGLPWLALRSSLESGFGALAGLIPIRTLLDYARTAFTDPGRPQADAASSTFDVSAGGTDIELGPWKSIAKSARYCSKCKQPKPARSHHCKVCQRCVLKMDHHCPFVNNCVGLRNHRSFCFFLLDVCIGTFLVAAVLAPQALDAVFYRHDPMTFAHRVRVVGTFGLCAFLQTGIVPFLLFHIQLLLHNETTLEFIGKRTSKRSAHRGGGVEVQQEMVSYSQGVFENFVEACGAPPACCERWLQRLLERLVPRHQMKRKE